MAPSYAPLPNPRYAPEDAQRELEDLVHAEDAAERAAPACWRGVTEVQESEEHRARRVDVDCGAPRARLNVR